LIEINFDAGKIVRDRTIDFVFVYNVDRRTRSLADFAKPVKLVPFQFESEITSKHKTAIHRIPIFARITIKFDLRQRRRSCCP
jgi:hypothetical protein